MMLTKPLPYQWEGIDTIEEHNGTILLADEMGLGKTAQVLWTLDRNPDWLPALVVCPASVKFTWEQQCREHIGRQPSICETRKPPVFNQSGFISSPKILIINYDILHYWAEYIQKLGIKTIVLDESQLLQNQTTIRTKTAKKLARHIPRVMCLSGTPFTNRPKDLFPTLNILWPKRYSSFWKYAQTFCDPKWMPWGAWDYKGATNLDQLHAELKDCGMLRRKKRDVLKDLPEKSRRVVPIEMSNPEEYLLAKNDFYAWLRKYKQDKVRSAMRAEKLTQLGYLLRLCTRLKMKGVIEWVNRFLEETEEKIILFAHHHQAIDLILSKVNAACVNIDGRVANLRNRQAAVDQFQKDPKTRVFVGSESASTGITLTAASTVGFVEMWWRPADHEQAEARPHRIGQENKVTANYFVVPGTIEEKLCHLLQTKQGTFSAVFDGGTTPDDINLYDELLAALEEEIKHG